MAVGIKKDLIRIPSAGATSACQITKQRREGLRNSLIEAEITSDHCPKEKRQRRGASYGLGVKVRAKAKLATLPCGLLRAEQENRGLSRGDGRKRGSPSRSAVPANTRCQARKAGRKPAS